jgi:hypothetical protein
MQCSNNLKQIALATHNFHDGRNGLPPAGINRHRHGLLLFLLPYTEKTAVWDWLSSTAPITNPDGSYCYFNNDTSLTPLHGLFGIPSTMRTGLIESWSGIEYSMHAPEWFYFLPTEYKESLSEIPYHFCPSKRNPRGQDAYFSAMEYSNAANVSDNAGPRADYAYLVSVVNNMAFADNMISAGCLTDWRGVGTPGALEETWNPAYQNGPFRVCANTYDTANIPAALLGSCVGLWNANTTNYITSWDPRDSFGFWADGTSNQLTLVEKHIPAWAMGTSEDMYAPWDSGIFMTMWHYDGGKVGVRQFIGADQSGAEIISVAKSPNQAETRFVPFGTPPLAADRPCQRLRLPLNSGFNYLIGSSHPGVFQAAVGDGSVHSIPVEISQEILSNLTQVDDGNAVSLP